MAAPVNETNVQIDDAESQYSGDHTSPLNELSQNNVAIAEELANDDLPKTTTVESANSASNQNPSDCLQVTNDGDIIIDAIDSEIIKRKKLSLTLPLLSVIDTAGSAHTSGNAIVAVEATSPNGSTAAAAPSSAPTSSCKIKKIYESDDTFIQTIFSQTIKSTTATPTDDDPSYTFEDFHGARIRGSMSSQRTKSDSLMTDDTPVEKLDVPIDGMSPYTVLKTSFFDKRLSETSDIVCIDDGTTAETAPASPPPSAENPTESFAYFHQTIDEDELHSPNDNECVDLDESPPHTTRTNTEPPLTNATKTITTRTASCTQDIAQITLSPSPIPEPEADPTSVVQCANDECASATNSNTNALQMNQQRNNDCDFDDDNASEQQINAADAISSYDNKHTETETENITQNTTSNNSSSHVSCVSWLMPLFTHFFLLFRSRPFFMNYYFMFSVRVALWCSMHSLIGFTVGDSFLLW